MAKLTASEFREKLQARYKNAIPDMQKGIERVTESPTAKAAKRTDKMLAGLQKAINSGKVAAGLNRVTLEEWKRKAINKGIARAAGGMDEAGEKIEAFASEFLPFQDGVTAKTRSMSDVTLEDNINRMVNQVRETSKFKRKG